MAISSGSRTQAGAQAFDVSVLAFPAASGLTVSGLMQLFNIDEASAQRLIASVPLLLTQQVTAAEAEACAQALRKLGARVVVEPTPLPTAQHSRWSQPGGYEEDLLPQPKPMLAHNDNAHADSGLEYDVLSSQEPAYAAEAAISTSPSMRSPLDLELSLHEPDRMAEDTALRRQRQDSIDLAPDHSRDPGPSLELASSSRPLARAEIAERPLPAPRVPAGPQPAARSKPRDAPAPHARAAVVQRTAVSEEKSKTLPLLQVCFALGVLAIGYWADSSVLFGSASLWSVAAHGVALYQLLLGVRGLSS